MRRIRRTASLTSLLAALLLAASTASVSAASVSFSSSYAVEISGGTGNGSVTYKVGSGVTGFLRATATADVFSNWYTLVSARQGRISSTSVRYTGATGGALTVRVTGDFSRDLSGGVSIASGAGFRHLIHVVLRDVSAAKDVRTWTFIDEEILCGGLVYPAGVGGCNGNPSDSFPSSWARAASGSGITNGHSYQIRIFTTSMISAVGLVAGLQGRTTARSLSGSISW